MARIKINLIGSPARLSIMDNCQYVEDLNEDLKICVDGGYEHFSHSGEFQQEDETSVAIFRWTGRTKIAE